MFGNGEECWEGCRFGGYEKSGVCCECKEENGWIVVIDVYE